MGGVLSDGNRTVSMGTGEIVVANQILQRGPDERSAISKMLDKMRGWWTSGAAAVGPLLMPYGWTDPRWWSDDPDVLPPAATEASVLGLPPFGRGVDLIASAGAGVDLVAYRYDPTDQIDVKLEPQPALLRDPDPIATPWGWRYAALNDLMLYGNSFAFLGDPNAEGWPMWLYPVDCTEVELGRDAESGMLVWRVAGQAVPFGELFHISAGNRSGRVLGRGVIAQYRDALSGVLATDRHTRKYFTQGGMPSAVIQSQDPDMTQDQADQIKAKYRATIGSGSREPMVIPSTYQFTPVVSDAEKQQLVEARKWDAQLAGMVLGLQPYQLGLPGTSMTYQNIEDADIAFVRDTVSRWTQPAEYAVSKWLLPTGQRARFDWTSRLRTDQKTRAQVLKTEIDAGLLTVDEGRRMLNRRPLPTPVVPPQLQQGAGGNDPNQPDGLVDGATGVPSEPTPEVAS